jgi:hypothetical protein
MAGQKLGGNITAPGQEIDRQKIDWQKIERQKIDRYKRSIVKRSNDKRLTGTKDRNNQKIKRSKI